MKLEVIAKTENQTIQDAIIYQIRDLINLKNLEPGDKLPSERMLSEKFGVTRGNVREAIQKLEFYGILKSIPQSGTFVANIGVIAMNGMIDDILRLEAPDFKDCLNQQNTQDQVNFAIIIAELGGQTKNIKGFGTHTSFPWDCLTCQAHFQSLKTLLQMRQSERAEAISILDEVEVSIPIWISLDLTE